jgi:hypothetical protein
MEVRLRLHWRRRCSTWTHGAVESSALVADLHHFDEEMLSLNFENKPPLNKYWGGVAFANPLSLKTHSKSELICFQNV